MPNAIPEDIVLPSDWYRLVVAEGVDTALPGLYEWRIDDVGSYIGKYMHISRPTRAYGRHVQNLLNGRAAYRRSNPNGYRRINYELEIAHTAGCGITLIILEAQISR